MVRSLIKKRSSMVAIALALTLAIAASLWFSVPAQAISVTSTVPSSMTVGRTYSFDIQIDVEAGEAVDIDDIKVIIYVLQLTNQADFAHIAVINHVPHQPRQFHDRLTGFIILISLGDGIDVIQGIEEEVGIDL